MIVRKHKNKILLVSGVGDTFFSPKSRKFLTHKAKLGDKITQHITNKIEDYYGVINLTLPTEYWLDVNPFTSVAPSRLINVVLNSNRLLDVSNEISLKNVNQEDMLFNGNELDFILPPDDFEIHICGVDINGIYKPVIQELLAKGFKVFLYSDMIKRYKETEQYIKSVRNRNFEYCSSKLALV